MTPRKLTPAEALEVFRDWRAVERADMTSTAFYDKWGTFDRAVSVLQLLTRDAIDAIEEAMAQKPPADEACPEWLRKSIEDHRKWAQSVRDKDAEKLHTLMARQEPAAPHAMEPSCAKCGHPQSNHPFRHPFQPVMLSLGASPPAAPVPSDEEIDSAIDAVRRHRLNPEDAFIEAYHALRKLAKRIGVKL